MLNRIQLVHYIIVFYNTRNEYTIDQVSEGLLDQHNFAHLAKRHRWEFVATGIVWIEVYI